MRIEKTNRLLISTLLFFPIVLCASAKVPLPSTGIQIVPLAMMDFPDSIKKHIAMKMEQEKRLGYQESDENYASDILMNRRTAKSEIEKYKNTQNPWDSHLKGSLSDIKLAFTFKSPPISESDILGYAPAGGVALDKNGKKGWTGVGVFFNNGPRQVCVYTYYNLMVSHGAIQLNKEATKYLVNKKPTSNYIVGNMNAGFVYSIEWYEKDSFSQLECADMQFDKEIMKTTIALANKIDADKGR